MKRFALLCACVLAGESMAAAESLPTWTNSLGMRFAEVPAGSFQTETQRKMRIQKPFSLGITEITQAQWQAVMDANPSHHKGRSLPVEMITWDEANEFCRRLSAKDGRTYRLPTEAEWEWACRASQSGSFETEIDQRAWTLANAAKTMPVAQRAPNPWGFFDMQGNVAEWCADVHFDRNAKTRTQRVVKGGAYCYGRLDARPSARMGIESAKGMAMRTGFVGVRVVCEKPR
jgi:formylglycine-generating enzyme required for sulfatase activity